MKKILSILTILFTFSFTSHSYSKTEIHWWYGNSGFLGDVIIEIANRFNASQNDYTVIPTGKGSYEDNMAATIAAFRAGDQPHYSQVYDAGAAIMVAQVKNGVVIGFEEMAEKYGIKVDADNYIPGIKNFYADSDGKMIGVPFNSSTCLMYANMDILKKVGIESVPKTYEEFEAMAPKIKAAGYIPLVQSHFPWIWTENFFSRHNLLMTDGNNGYDAVPTKTLFAETDAFVMHWKKVKEWYESGLYGYKGRAWGDNQAPFIAGEAAFWFGSAASFGGMKGVVPNFSVNHIPYWDSVTKGKEYPTFIGGAANWILNGHTEEEYKGLAKFIEFMGSPEMDLYYHNMTGYSAVTKGGIELAETINFYRTSPYHKAVGEQLSLEGSTIPGGYRAGNWPQIREVIYENVEPMLNGKISIEKGLKNMDKGAAKLLKQFAKTL
jgi:sn-glycerol 3-phosphate transport system substrate-binding protein